MASPFRHNKKRNSALVYEFIVREMGAALIDRDESAYKKSLGLAKKYFSEGTPLAQELEIFQTVRDNRGVTEGAAWRIVSEVKRRAGQFDHKKIEIKKSNLIKELNHTFGRDFFSKHRLDEYRLLASVQILIDTCRVGKPLGENVQQIRVEEALAKFMVSSETPRTHKIAEEKVDDLVCTLATQKFVEKYGHSLSEGQNRILRSYMQACMTGNFDRFGKFLNDTKSKVISSLEKATGMKEVVEDDVMAGRLDEAREKMKSLDVTVPSEGLVEEIMLFQKLVEEIVSNG